MTRRFSLVCCSLVYAAGTLTSERAHVVAARALEVCGAHIHARDAVCVSCVLPARFFPIGCCRVFVRHSPLSDRADALESALQSGSGTFLRDVLGSEGGTLPARCAIKQMVPCVLSYSSLNLFDAPQIALHALYACHERHRTIIS